MNLLNIKRKVYHLLLKNLLRVLQKNKRKILTLFLISDNESQFNAHIIYDLIANQTHLFNAQPHADILYRSLHWKVQVF